ncbi:MAG: polysaccharide biosynthesis tyrosine autokinase [Acidobacteria bacterium]|nr:polysaccharide biosynthesis tyrosine autokinase [Acidobacteriota bacterium]
MAESRPSVTRIAPPTLDKHLLDYLRVLVKRRWVAVAGIVLAVMVAGLHLYSAVPIYESAVQLLIEHEAKNTFSLEDQVSQDRETTDYYNTQFTILQSRSLARRTIEAMGAWEHAELSGGSAPANLQPTNVMEGAINGLKKVASLVRQGSSTAAAAAEDTGVAAAPPASGRVETPEQAAVIDAFLSRLTIAPVKTSRMVDVKMRATDPQFASDAANALARAYIEQNLEVRMTSSKETSDWLTEQLSEQRKRIEVAETNLQRYRERHDAMSLADRQNMVGQKLSDLSAMVTRAKADRIGRETLYQQVRDAGTNVRALETLPAIAADPTVQQYRGDLARLQADYARLSQDLLDGHPEMVRLRAATRDAEGKLQRELQKQVEAIRSEYDSAVTLETSLTAALETQRREATVMGRTGIDYGVLEREVQTNRQIFESLLERTREKGIAGELRASDARVIDPAQVPRSSMWPNRNQTLFYALVFGSLIGVGLAFFAEYMDDRLKTPDELKTYLGLPFVGLVPAIASKDFDGVTGDGTPLLHTKVSPLFSEAFRTIRTTILLSADERPQSLVVTSTGPGEGKTVVSSNIALAMAMAGRKVLLIDIDMRRPRVHKVFGLDAHPGLSDVLAGKVDVEQALRETNVPNLWVMPSGSPTDTPSEGLSSPQFATLLSTMGQRFSWIILDSPPVAAVTDACIVANRASAVLFVVGSQLTSRAAAQHAVEQLDVAGATYLGTVLNKVALRRDAFYYSTYYRPSYERYHASSQSNS